MALLVNALPPNSYSTPKDHLWNSNVHNTVVVENHYYSVQLEFMEEHNYMKVPWGPKYALILILIMLF